MSERERFEAHCRDMLPDMSLDHVNYADNDDNKTWGDYIDNDIEWMWNGWQAALADHPEHPAIAQLLFSYEAILTEMRTHARTGGIIAEWVRRIDFARNEYKATTGRDPYHDVPPSQQAAQVRAEHELQNFVSSKRFDRSVFDDDTAMVDWILSRARAALAANSQKINESGPVHCRTPTGNAVPPDAGSPLSPNPQQIVPEDGDG